MGGHHEPDKVVGSSSNAILVATPSTDDKKINIYQFPDEKLKYVVPKISTTDSGEYSIPRSHLLPIGHCQRNEIGGQPGILTKKHTCPLHKQRT